MSNIVILGATSSIATECARLWVAQGHNLFLVGRNAGKLTALHEDLQTRATDRQIIATTTADLTDQTGHDALFSEAATTLGGMDILLIAHGTLPDQSACQSSVALTMDAIQSNALSVLSLLTIAANLFEAQRRGIIAVIGSVAGDRGRQSNYVYGAAKGMVDLFLQGLRNRLYKAGVAVVTIKPGFVDTPMTAHIARKGLLWASPVLVAEGIIRAVANKADIVYLPRFWRLIMWIIRAMPETVFKRLSL